MRKLEISRQSEIELIQIRKYTSESWGQQQSDKYLTELQNTMFLLQENPYLGFKRFTISDGVYSFPHIRHMIYYKFDNEKLYIMAILHQSMLPKNHLKERIK